MARQKLPTTIRRALWEAHGMACGYCRTPLAYRDMEIDHVIPQKLLNDPIKLQELAAEVGIPSDFSITGYQNLLPACRRCNSDKRDRLLFPGRLAIDLANAQAIEPRVASLASKYEEQDRFEKIKLALAIARERGTLTDSQIRDLLRQTLSGDKIPLSYEISIFGDEPLRELSDTDYERLIDAPVQIGEGWEDGLRLVNDNNDELHVKTLREHESATGNGFYALSNAEMRISYTYFAEPLALLQIAQRAAIAERSFVDEPQVGLADISLLSAELLFEFGEEDSESNGATTKTIANLVDEGVAVIKFVSSQMLIIEHNGNYTSLLEVMRADISGNGEQEILVHSYGQVIGATLWIADLILLGRSSRDAKFETRDLKLRLKI